MGYVIGRDYDMPPLMLTPDELDATMLGAAWVAQRVDPALARGTCDLAAKHCNQSRSSRAQSIVSMYRRYVQPFVRAIR
jgi:predicted DNA-binding transcriptional regulator YafY